MTGITRRNMGLAGAGLLMAFQPGCASAQRRPAAPATSVRAPANVVLPRPLPCANRPGDITGFLLEGAGSPAGTVAVIGQAFRPGDMPRSATLGARMGNGTRVPAQLDVTTRHPDGSARFGLVSLALPALAAGQAAGVVLTRDGAPMQPLRADAALAGRSAVLTLTPGAGGSPWSIDLLARLRDQQAGGRRPWQAGPLALQWRVALPVPEAVVGAASLRVVADVSVRADGTLWVDAWLRNDTAMRPGGGSAHYAVRLVIDGREALRAGPLQHGQYQAWGRLVGGAAGARPAPAMPILRPDVPYLADAAAIPRYDQSTGAEAALLARLAQEREAPEWSEPLAARGITRDMRTTGGRFDLGPVTGWQASWLVSGDPRAGAFVLDQAEAAGAVPWHYWDPAGGADGSGGWLDAQRWPRLWSDVRGGRPPYTLAQPVPRDIGWIEDAAHQPSLSYVPYLLTGRRAFLDNLQAQAAWNVTSNWPANRYDRRWSGRIVGLNLMHNRQVRSAAWGIRTVDEAAWISPDDDPMAPYLREITTANWAWMREQIPALTELQGEVHGWWPPSGYGRRGDASPWQQDYLVAAAAAAARRGNDDARAMLAWMANFVVGRFTAGDRGFAPHDGVAYTLALVPLSERNPRPYRSWAEIGEQTRARGLSNGDGWATSGGEYGRLALQSLAQLSDALDHAQARRAFMWLDTAGAPFTDTQSHARIPTLNIVPRDFARVSARAPRCSAGGG
ncbi:hypothetical protein J8J14_10175 [Roseomonas sp. SSH11]|uniref:Uncharacterized protein n=1 Tax=Pararoseomonas baculiformis TaxID=2820812 RepID=A0ABS4ADQ4_9PROT|nr:hypothetical protein [Pararoseomonas baculiformis]MBP0445146.1 hypothetical protein [Pararoseomonas baculiformis]